MNTLAHEVWIKADRATVFDALTTREGLDAWWGPALSAEPRVGSVVEFDHGHGTGTLLRMRITGLVPSERLEWRCLSDFTDPQYPGSDWLGHRIVFELETAVTAERGAALTRALGIEDPTFTVLWFRHMGWTSETRWAPFCNTSWGATLSGDLKSYCESERARRPASVESITG